MGRFLTIEGIKYLREYLNLPSDTNIVPATHKRSTRPERRPAAGGRFGDEGGAREGGYRDREGYRAGPREGGLEAEKVGMPSFLIVLLILMVQAPSPAH